MIRVLYMSDLHIEMERKDRPLAGLAAWLRGRPGAHGPGPALDHVPRPDLIVLAGDIHNGLNSLAYAERLAWRFEVPVVLVAGNHEYYYQNVAQLRPALQARAGQSRGRVHVLENQLLTLELAGRRLHVLGCTLWTDFGLNQDEALSSAYAGIRMNDYRLINDADERLTPARTMAWHRDSRFWLHETLLRLRAEDPATPRLIVTHHAPGKKFVGARDGAIAPAYASDLLREFSSHAPGFWVHGHTHFRHETYSNGFWVVSAPRGYRQEVGTGWDSYQPGVLEI